MATTKKAVVEEKTAETMAAPVEAKEVVEKDPWETKVKIHIPRATNGEPNYIITSVNGRTFKVQRGMDVVVPAPIAEVLQHSFEAQEEALRFIDQHSN